MPDLHVSPKAVEEIHKLLAKRGKPTKGLRIGVRGGGCTGFGYLFEWCDEEPRATDRVFEFDEGKVKVFCDPKSLVYLESLRSSPKAGLLTTWTLKAPDQVEYRIRGGASAIILGERRWDRDRPGAPWRRSQQLPVLRVPQPA